MYLRGSPAGRGADRHQGPARQPDHPGRGAGIATVYQDLALFDNLDATANFCAGREIAGMTWLPRPLRPMLRRDMTTAAQTLLDRLQVKLPSPNAPVGLMSGGQRQAVAVARAAAFALRVIILDEPTAALGLRETRQVMDLVGRLREQGLAMILTTHNMDQVTGVADRAAFFAA